MTWIRLIFPIILVFQCMNAQRLNFTGNDARAMEVSIERKINSLFSFVAHTREWANITDTVSLYILPVKSVEKFRDGQIDASIQRTGPSTLAIILDERMMFFCPEEGLKAIVAHELGHFICGHPIDKEVPTGDEFERFQAEADAMAIFLVGEEAMIESLKWLRFDETYINERLEKAKKALMNAKLNK